MDFALPITLSDCGAFFKWWGSELRGLLPGIGHRAAVQQAPRVIVGVEGSGFRLYEGANGKSSPQEAGAAPLQSQEDLLNALRALAKSRRAADIGLRMPYAACFVRRIEIPATAEAHVGKLLALDLERNSPFKPREIRTAHCTDPARTSAGKLCIRQLIIKRAAVDGLMRDIEALGIDVVRLDCWNEDGTAALPVNFLDADLAQSQPSRAAKVATAVLGGSAVALAASSVFVLVARHEAALRDLQAQTAQTKTRAFAGREALARSQAQFAQFAALQRARREYVSRAAALEELTRLFPDSAWVNDLRFEGSTVDVTGLASSAANLVRILERSGTFVDATMTAPVTLDPREEKERFSIRVRLRNASVGSGKSADGGTQ